jgi:hypothetical protein
LEDVDVIIHELLPDSSTLLTVLSIVRYPGTSKKKAPPKTGLIFGSPGRTRTIDKVVNSHSLYRLSYRGI